VLERKRLDKTGYQSLGNQREVVANSWRMSLGTGLAHRVRPLVNELYFSKSIKSERRRWVLAQPIRGRGRTANREQ
jgi:hypothetical protein